MDILLLQWTHSPTFLDQILKALTALNHQYNKHLRIHSLIRLKSKYKNNCRKFRSQRQAQTTNQFKYPPTVSQIPQMPAPGTRSRMAPSSNIPHSRSETNFYRQ